MENWRQTTDNWRLRNGESEGFRMPLSPSDDTRTNTNWNGKFGNNNNFVYHKTHLEPVLWKKETTHEDSLYVDPYASIQFDYQNDVQQWKHHLNDLNSPETARLSEKNNNIADRLMECGHAEFHSHNWNDALNSYSQALCFAERGTMYEGLAYGNRALCFFQLGMYRNAVIDFDFAAKKRCPEPFLVDVQSTRAECQKMAKKHTEPKVRVPKLRVSTDKKFPCMASSLEIKRNKDFGRCVFAKRDIEIGQTVLVAESFASAITTEKQVYCLTCQKMEMNFIPCKNCSDVMFCDEDCVNYENLHKMECQTCYHQINDVSLKFVVQTILVAIDMFPNIESLIAFVDEVTSDKGCDKIPKTSCDAPSKYGIFLKLTPTFKDEYLFRAYQAFTYINLIPKVKYLFDTEAKQRFLMHLVLHHTIVIPKNAFFDVAQFTDQFTVKYIFDVLSIVNHSCAPNLHFATSGKLGYCIAVRPIKKGDQVFINYLGDDVHKLPEERQKLLKDNWGFECQCDKCVIIEYSPEYEVMKMDPSLKYVIRNFENNQITPDNTKRMQLKKQCIKFLKKYGHLPWSTDLAFVINCFTSL
ncbi:SET and MYND domain-containing protein 4-like [Sitodiplosis mosellana]|uniref:SET and MYND domain-containing protein 4-like n=1 Tax=Sitodiplosis mosellana TaxID=263140 RepID=UPI0024445862|nr:SET and MYND domain-containing protein 4-like [Sitodiplosis mosellana]